MIDPIEPILFGGQFTYQKKKEPDDQQKKKDVEDFDEIFMEVKLKNILEKANG